jgi:hypothetical protein
MQHYAIDGLNGLSSEKASTTHWPLPLPLPPKTGFIIPNSKDAALHVCFRKVPFAVQHDSPGCRSADLPSAEPSLGPDQGSGPPSKKSGDLQLEHLAGVSKYTVISQQQLS